MKSVRIVDGFEFRYEQFAPENEHLAVLIAGFGAPIKFFTPAVKYLQKRNFSVLTIEYDNTVLSTGDPQNLLQLIKKLTEFVKDASGKYGDLYICGPSLGSYIGFNILVKLKRDKSVGMFAASGITVSRAVFHSPNFAETKKAFIKHGYDEAKLLQAWREIETDEQRRHEVGDSPPFVIHSTKYDKIVDYKTARPAMKTWQDANVAVKFKTVPLPGHYAISLWHMRNGGKLIVKDQKARAKTR